jgi:hypothetical protein
VDDLIIRPVRGRSATNKRQDVAMSARARGVADDDEIEHQIVRQRIDRALTVRVMSALPPTTAASGLGSILK